MGGRRNQNQHGALGGSPCREREGLQPQTPLLCLHPCLPPQQLALESHNETQAVASAPENSAKNRYRNVLPCESRGSGPCPALPAPCLSGSPRPAAPLTLPSSPRRWVPSASEAPPWPAGLRLHQRQLCAGEGGRGAGPGAAEPARSNWGRGHPLDALPPRPLPPTRASTAPGSSSRPRAPSPTPWATSGVWCGSSRAAPWSC